MNQISFRLNCEIVYTGEKKLNEFKSCTDDDGDEATKKRTEN